MMQRCKRCGRSYDDRDRGVECPHPLVIPKDRAPDAIRCTPVEPVRAEFRH